MIELNKERDPREGRIILCEALGCNDAATVWNSPSWRKTWRMIWVEADKHSYSACSEHCADEIKKGRYRKLNEKPMKKIASMKPEQMKLF